MKDTIRQGQSTMGRTICDIFLQWHPQHREPDIILTEKAYGMSQYNVLRDITGMSAPQTPLLLIRFQLFSICIHAED
jgi:hypothetical protein